MYNVVRKFEDKDGRIYEVGDIYPSPDAKKPNNARIKVLSTINNKYGQVYIQKTPHEKG